MHKLKIIRNLNNASGLLVAVFAVVLVAIVMLAWLRLSDIETKRNQNIEEKMLSIYNNLAHETGLIEQSATTAALSVASQQDIQQALKLKDRELAQDYLIIDFNVFRSRLNITNLMLVESDGRVLTRIRRPQVFGDSLADNPLIATALNEQNPVGGVDIVPDATGIWSLSPVFDEGDFVGLVAVGVDYQEILNTFKAGQDADYQIWFVDTALEDGIQPTEGDPNSIEPEIRAYAATFQAPKPLSNELYDKALATRMPQVQTITGDTGAVAVLMAPVQTRSERSIGLIEISVSVEKEMQASRRDILGVIASAVGLALLSLVLMWILINVIVYRPLEYLTSVVSRRIQGDDKAPVVPESAGLFIKLGEKLNQQTQTVSRTEESQKILFAQQASELELILEVARHQASGVEFEQFLDEIVSLVNTTFNLYHTHIYLIDEERAVLSILKGFGRLGEEMKRKGHRIPLIASQSLVSQAARKGKLVLVNDTRNDPLWLPNPLLPHTRSELAIPVKTGNKIWGVLDLQSDKAYGITRQQVDALQAVAIQISIAVRNANLLTQAQGALIRAEEIQRLYNKQSWQGFSSDQRINEHEYRRQGLLPLGEIATPEAHLAFGQKQTVNLYTKVSPTDSDPVSTLATPLRLRDQIIGVLGVHDQNQNRKWTDDEILLIEAVSEQMTLALENARLFEDAQRNAWRDRVVSETTAKVWASSEIDAVMKEAVAQLGDKLQASEVVIRLGAGFSLPDQD